MRLLLLALLLSAVPTGSHAFNLIDLDHRDNIYSVVKNGEDVWAVGYPGKMLHSKDKGNTWKLLSVAKKSDALFSIDFGDSKVGLISGRDGVILRTMNGGKNWTRIDTKAPEPLFDVEMVGPNKAWAVGHFNTILHSSDGGVSWQKQVFELSEDAFDEPGLHAVSFADEKNGWIVGEFGTILHTEDGGETWNAQKSGVAYSLYDVCFSSPMVGTAVGSWGTVLRTENGGNNWVKAYVSEKEHLYTLFHLDEAHFIAVGQDGGLVEGNMPPGVAPSETMSSEEDKTNAEDTKDVALTEDGEPGSPPISKVEAAAPNIGQYKHRKIGIYTWLDNLQFFDAKRGLAVGGRGNMLLTEDGGQTWTNISGK